MTKTRFIAVKTIRRAAASLGIVALGSIFATSANAGCGAIEELNPNAIRVRQPSLHARPPYRAGLFMLAAEEQRYGGQSAENAPITGLWSVQFVAKGNIGITDGTVIDQGYATWHADGTEIMNSGRAPLTGSFCMGVWKQNGHLTYDLNHFALSWDPTGMTLIGPAQIQEVITVDPAGDTYSGTFTIDQFDTMGNDMMHVTGTVSGKRITVD
jgi:hypothetical protein